jgi:hypothetical protein
LFWRVGTLRTFILTKTLDRYLEATHPNFRSRKKEIHVKIILKEKKRRNGGSIEVQASVADCDPNHFFAKPYRHIKLTDPDQAYKEPVLGIYILKNLFEDTVKVLNIIIIHFMYKVSKYLSLNEVNKNENFVKWTP